MYDLGDQFVLDLNKARPNPASVLQGDKYRITVLTERLVRLEYSETGEFEDKPTELVWYRNFPKPEFNVINNRNNLVIETKYFSLSYTKEAKFAGTAMNKTANLRIDLNGVDKTWYYGHQEVKNFGAPVLQKNGSTDDNKEFNMKGLYSIDGFTCIDDSDDYLFNQRGNCVKRANNEIDLYVFMYGKDFTLALKDYFMITGYPALIPRYALGNWWSRNDTYNDNTIDDLIENFDNHKIPLSVLMLDKDWHIRPTVGDKRLRTGFTFNGDLFKNPSNLVERLHNLGIRLGVNISPIDGFYPTEAFYKTAAKYIEPKPEGYIPFNVYDSKTIDVYLKVFIHPLDNYGIDFFWIDWYDKTRENELTLLKHYHYYDMMRGYKRRPMIYGYNSRVAAHRYPVLYAGKSVVSWETLANIPYFNGRAANIGVSWWSHDIGGYFNGTEDNELYERYIQLGTFSPILKLSADAGRFYKREPWRWNVQTYAIATEYLNLRHKLVPYIYSEAYKYYKFGIPIIQPVYYQYPELYDDTLYKNEYSFGSQFFVCPITSKKDLVMNRVIHKFFLPEGNWFNFRSGKKFVGKKKIVSFFKDEEYPVFVKEGAIIPMALHANRNDTTPPKNMEIQIFPGKSNSFKLYEDDGVSDLYLQGYSLTTLIDYNYLPNNYTVIIRPLEGKTGIIPATRNYTIRFRNTRKSTDVQAFIKSTKTEVKSYIDGPDFIVELKDIPTTEQLTLNCKGKDIEINAMRIILEDVEEIISDLPLMTSQKDEVFNLLIDKNLTKDKKRIEFHKLAKGKNSYDKKYIQLFIQLLEYMDQIQ